MCVISSSMQIFKTKIGKKITLPYFSSLVQAGFPSPADDYINEKLDLNERYIQHPSSTFLVKVEGDSMIGAGIFPNDTLIIDRAEKVRDGDVVLAIVNNDFTIKRYKKVGSKMYLLPENPEFEAIEITKDMYFEVWGVVTLVMHKP